MIFFAVEAYTPETMFEDLPNELIEFILSSYLSYEELENVSLNERLKFIAGAAILKRARKSKNLYHELLINFNRFKTRRIVISMVMHFDSCLFYFQVQIF